MQVICDLQTICTHYQRGACAFGSNCFKLHIDPEPNAGAKGLILQNSISALNFPDKFSSSNFGQTSTSKNNRYKLIPSIMENNL
jgi:hypothetical protein